MQAVREAVPGARTTAFAVSGAALRHPRLMDDVEFAAWTERWRRAKVRSAVMQDIVRVGSVS